jgi:hypothetical protein
VALSFFGDVFEPFAPWTVDCNDLTPSARVTDVVNDLGKQQMQGQNISVSD